LTGVLEEDAKALNKKFFLFHLKHRPYIILKWAETANRKISSASDERLLISNELSNRLVHCWRSESDAILVGTNTALKDNPSLTNRLWSGKHPVRLVIDKSLRLPSNLNLFDKNVPTIVFNEQMHREEFNLSYVQLVQQNDLLTQVLQICYHRSLQSILVEGGAALLQSFIDAGLWDEARVIRNEDMIISDGLAAPELKNHQLTDRRKLRSDLISVYQRTL